MREMETGDQSVTMKREQQKQKDGERRRQKIVKKTMNWKKQTKRRKKNRVRDWRVVAQTVIDRCQERGCRLA